MQHSDLERLAQSTDDGEHVQSIVCSLTINVFQMYIGSGRSSTRTNGGRNPQFYEKWLFRPFEQSKKFPYLMVLGTDDKGMSPLNSPRNTMASEIASPMAYDEMFDRILEFREERGAKKASCSPGSPPSVRVSNLCCDGSPPEPILLQENPHS